MMTFLESRVNDLVRKYGLSHEVVHGILGDFLKALHETKYKVRGQFDGSLLSQSHLALGDEATYHLGGLLRSSNGDDLVSTELEYIESSIKRFGAILQTWGCEVHDEMKGRDN